MSDPRSTGPPPPPPRRPSLSSAQPPPSASAAEFGALSLPEAPAAFSPARAQTQPQQSAAAALPALSPYQLFLLQQQPPPAYGQRPTSPGGPGGPSAARSFPFVRGYDAAARLAEPSPFLPPPLFGNPAAGSFPPPPFARPLPPSLPSASARRLEDFAFAFPFGGADDALQPTAALTRHWSAPDPSPGAFAPSMLPLSDEALSFSSVLPPRAPFASSSSDRLPSARLSGRRSGPPLSAATEPPSLLSTPLAAPRFTERPQPLSAQSSEQSTSASSPLYSPLNFPRPLMPPYVPAAFDEEALEGEVAKINAQAMAALPSFKQQHQQQYEQPRQQHKPPHLAQSAAASFLGSAAILAPSPDDMRPPLEAFHAQLQQVQQQVPGVGRGAYPTVAAAAFEKASAASLRKARTPSPSFAQSQPRDSFSTAAFLGAAAAGHEQQQHEGAAQRSYPSLARSPRPFSPSVLSPTSASAAAAASAFLLHAAQEQPTLPAVRSTERAALGGYDPTTALSPEALMSAQRYWLLQQQRQLQEEAQSSIAASHFSTAIAWGALGSPSAAAGAVFASASPDFSPARSVSEMERYGAFPPHTPGSVAAGVAFRASSPPFMGAPVGSLTSSARGSPSLHGAFSVMSAFPVRSRSPRSSSPGGGGEEGLGFAPLSSAEAAFSPLRSSADPSLFPSPSLSPFEPGRRSTGGRSAAELSEAALRALRRRSFPASAAASEEEARVKLEEDDAEVQRLSRSAEQRAQLQRLQMHMAHSQQQRSSSSSSSSTMAREGEEAQPSSAYGSHTAGAASAPSAPPQHLAPSQASSALPIPVFSSTLGPTPGAGGSAATAFAAKGSASSVARRRRPSELAPHEVWLCPYNCDVVYRTTSSRSISRHAARCPNRPLYESMRAAERAAGLGGSEDVSGKRRQKRRRKNAELLQHERWNCPRLCGTFFRSTSTRSIQRHRRMCDFEPPTPHAAAEDDAAGGGGGGGEGRGGGGGRGDGRGGAPGGGQQGEGSPGQRRGSGDPGERERMDEGGGDRGEGARDERPDASEDAEGLPSDVDAQGPSRVLSAVAASFGCLSLESSLVDVRCASAALPRPPPAAARSTQLLSERHRLQRRHRAHCHVPRRPRGIPSVPLASAGDRRAAVPVVRRWQWQWGQQVVVGGLLRCVLVRCIRVLVVVVGVLRHRCVWVAAAAPCDAASLASVPCLALGVGVIAAGHGQRRSQGRRARQRGGGGHGPRVSSARGVVHRGVE